MLTKIYYAICAAMIIGFVVFASCRKKEKAPLIPDDYRSWKRITDSALDYPIPGHESNCRIIYINAIGEQVQPTEQNNRVSYDYPEGTVIVKEIYAGLEPPEKDEIPEKLTVMIKDAQHPESRNGWLWILKDVKTGEETLIDYEFCVECHANANEPHPYGDKNPNGDFRDYAYFLPPHRGKPVEP